MASFMVDDKTVLYTIIVTFVAIYFYGLKIEQNTLG